jgi:glycosyltransferase involved in cell wall biosynthesis
MSSIPNILPLSPSAPVPTLAAGILISAGVIYLAVLLTLTIGIWRCHSPGGESQAGLRVSVLIAAKDEAAVIDACLGSLEAQNYPAELTQVVVINDGSADGTEDRASAWSDRIAGLQVISVNEERYHLCPKKNALEHGIRATDGDLIITTDADCRPPPGWISSLVKAFGPSGGKSTGMVGGYAPLSPASSMRERLLAVQALLVAGVSAGSASVGFPLACTGRNLAYRREAFSQVGGFDGIGNVVGGDDVLLMRKIATSGQWTVRFHPGPEAAVPSAPHRDGQLGRQIRYQSKAIHYGLVTLILLIPVYTFHLALAAGPLLAWTYGDFWPVLGVAFASKVVVDVAFLILTSLRLNDTRNVSLFPLIEVLSVPYVVCFSALGALRKKPTPWR